MKNNPLDMNVARDRRGEIMEMRPKSRAQLMKALYATLSRLSLCSKEWILKLFKQ